MRANLILKSFACLAVAGVIAGCGGQKKKEEAAKAEQAKITQAAAKPVTGKPSAGNARTAANSALPTTGDNAALAGETFVIGGVVLVAAGVFLTDKKRRQE